MEIREIKASDGAAFLTMQIALDQTTEFMLLKPGERTASVSETTEMITHALHNKDFFLVSLDDKGEISGYIYGEKGRYSKISHIAYIVVGLLPTSRGKGIGTSFFKALDTWALQEKILRLELTVLSINTGAIRLYEKAGFITEGIRRKAMYQNGDYMDEYYMAKLIE